MSDLVSEYGDFIVTVLLVLGVVSSLTYMLRQLLMGGLIL